MNQEAGGLRIQRVPPTEKRGRVHTSTVTVAVLGADTTSVFQLNDSDLRIEWFSGTGKGGQHRNKHQNSCRLIHIPTGLITTSQTRSRENSLKMARLAMEQMLREQYSNQEHRNANQQRKHQVGSGERGDKVRTLRFQNNQVKDHVTGKQITATEFMKGFMFRLWR